MTRPQLIGWCLVLTAGVGAVIPCGRAALGARRAADVAHDRLIAATAQARELAALRTMTPRERRPGSGLASRVSAALTRCGLQASALSSLSPESAFAEGGEGGTKRQRAVLALDGATLPQVGSFLEAWRNAEPEWVVSSVELAPQTGKTVAPPTPGGDLPLRAVIAVEAVYVEKIAASLVDQPGGGR